MPGNQPATTAVPRTIPAMLIRAAHVIDANGLHRGDLLDIEAACHTEDLRQVPVCAAGAIRIAAGHDPDDYSAQVPAMQAFADWLSRSGAVPADALGRFYGDAMNLIGFWNDELTRTAADVTAALQQAARAAAHTAACPPRKETTDAQTSSDTGTPASAAPAGAAAGARRRDRP